MQVGSHVMNEETGSRKNGRKEIPRASGIPALDVHLWGTNERTGSTCVVRGGNASHRAHTSRILMQYSLKSTFHAEHAASHRVILRP